MELERIALEGDLIAGVGGMLRFLLRVRRWLRSEIVLGFLIATVFWAGILGWQAADAPIDAEKQKCYDAAEKTGHKAEECKSLWERTTSDPVAFFTFWLVVSTIGLGISTAMLWFAGEKQFRHARRSAMTQSRDMQASIMAAAQSAAAMSRIANSDRAWVCPDNFQIGSSTNTVDEQGTLHPEALLVTPGWRNFGRSPAISVASISRDIVLAANSTVPHFDVPEDSGEARGVIATGFYVNSATCFLFGRNLERFKAREIDWFIYSRVTYSTISDPDIRRVSESCVRVIWDGLRIDSAGNEQPNLRIFAGGPQSSTS